MVGEMATGTGKRMVTDTEALERIHALMDGTEWSSDTLEAIAESVTLSGRVIRDPSEMPED